MTPLIVIYDACVLYPATLRSFLLYLATEDIYRARWSDDIHDEWIANVLKNHPDIRPEQLARTRQLMDAHVEDCLVTGYRSLIQTLTLPDPQDRHVLAAAIAAKAAVIVTSNLKHFPNSALNPHGLEAQSPDHFVAHIFDLSPLAVCRAFQNHRVSLKNPPRTTAELLTMLERCGLPKTAKRLQAYPEQL